MFKKLKAKLEEKRLEKDADNRLYLRSRIFENEQKLVKYEQLLKDFTDNYVPVRSKCIDVICKHDLGRYPLKTVLKVTVLADNKIEFKVFDIKETYWDEEKTLFRDEVLLDEIIQLNTLKLLNTHVEDYDIYSEYDKVLESLNKLEDVTEGFASAERFYSSISVKFNEELNI